MGIQHELAQHVLTMQQHQQNGPQPPTPTKNSPPTSPAKYKIVTDPATGRPLTPPDERICPSCLGFGYTRFDVPAGHPAFGRAQPCPDRCSDTAARSRLNNISGLNATMREITFNHTWHPIVEPAAKHIKDQVMTTVPRGMVLLTGPYGVGKTHIMAAAVNLAITTGRTALFIKAEAMLQAMRDTYGDKTSETASVLLSRLNQVTVLAIDEIDRINPTDWAQTQIFQILNERYERALWSKDPETAFTLIATNAKAQALDGYLQSRLADGLIGHTFDLTGAPDLRKLS